MMRIGIVGLGVIHQYYLQAIEKNPTMQLVSVCDTNQEILARSSAALRKYSHVQELLHDGDLDTLVITLPNHLHESTAAQALASGLHVICEKPLALNGKGAKQLVDLSHTTGKVLYTVFHRRFNRNIADLIGVQNNIVGFEAWYDENIIEHAGRDVWYMDSKRSGGGCVMDNGSNVFDVLRHLIGTIEIQRAGLFYERDIETKADIDVQFRHGSGTIHLDWRYRGERKKVCLKLADGSVFERDFLSGATGYKSSLFPEYEAALRDFSDCVRFRSEHGENGLNALRLVEDTYAIANKD